MLTGLRSADQAALRAEVNRICRIEGVARRILMRRFG
jgi:hypothetical protein